MTAACRRRPTWRSVTGRPRPSRSAIVTSASRGELGIVRDQHDRRLARAIDVEQQLDDLLAGLAVEVAGRLVGEQERRIVGQRAGDRDALLLAAGELRRIVMAAVGKADFGEQRVARAPGVARAGNLHRHEHVLERGQRRQQVKELKDEADALAAETRERVFVERRDVDAVDHDASARRRVEARRAARAAWTCRCRTAGDRDDASRREP